MPAFQVNTKWAAMSQITPGLYICGVSALQPDDLMREGITCIINCTTEVPNLNRLGCDVDRIKLWLEDTDETDISGHLRLIPDQIEMAIRGGGKVLVHCVAGVSRSAAIVLAYLLKFQFKSLRECYHFLSSKRAMVRPNLGFWHQLIDYELEVKGRTSVRIIKGQNLFGQPRNTVITDRPGSSDNLECADGMDAQAEGCDRDPDSRSLPDLSPSVHIPDIYLPIVLPPSDKKPRFFVPNGMEVDSENRENSYPSIAEQETRERKGSGSSLKFVPSLATLQEVEP